MFLHSNDFFSCNVLKLNSLESASMNNQECKIRPEIININTNESLFYLYNIKINRCKGSCNTIKTHRLKYVSLTKLRTQM